MKNWFPLAVALFVLLHSDPAPGGSLAARVRAARQAREAARQAREAASPAHAAATETAPVIRRPATTVKASPSGRINVADWLNGTPRSNDQRQREIEPDAAAVAPPAGASGRHTETVPHARRGTTPTPSAILKGPEGLDLTQPLVEKSTGELSPLPDVPPANYPSLDIVRQDVTTDSATESDSATASETAVDATTRDEQPAAEVKPSLETADQQVEESEPETEIVPQEVELDGTDMDQEEVELDEQGDRQEVKPLRLAPITPKKHFSPQMLSFRDRIRSCLMYYYQRPESASERSPWGVMHALIAFGVDTDLTAGGQHVNAIGWLCYNRPCRNMRLFSFDGRYPVPRNGPGYQGHEGQFLSMLALSRVKSTYPMRVDGHELTVQDLIEYEKATCRPKSELTFKLIGLAHYLPSDARWTSKRGEPWSIPRLIQEELAQPINGACCGGTHRLIGYSMAVRSRQKRGEPIDGQWLRARKYVDSYHKYVIKLQNRDGSFSTQWLKGRDGSGDLDRRIQTTGHILEWLVFSLPENELTDPRIVRAVNYLNSALLKYRQKDWEIGPRGHALRALALYNERVFGDKPGERRALLARRPKK